MTMLAYSKRDKTQAGELLERMGLTGVYPVPVEQVVMALGFSLNGFTPDPETKDIAGAVDHEAKAVWVNTGDPPVRQRFTIAHEIGHIELHGGQSTVDYRANLTDSTDAKEVAANKFAADLLMDPIDFVKAWFRLDCDVDAVAKHFAVSKEAAKVRARSFRLL